MTGFSLSRSLVVAALLACFTVSAAAQEEEKAKKRKGARGQARQGFFSADAQRAVPGLNGLVAVTKEQRQGIAKIRKEALADEAYQAALKTSKDKSAERADRRAAQKTIKDAKAALQAKFVGVLTAEQQTLVAKVNAAADAPRARSAPHPPPAPRFCSQEPEAR